MIDLIRPSGQETNPYLYAAGNPVNASDPTGLEVDWAAVGSAIVSGATELVVGTLLGAALAGICGAGVLCAIGISVASAVLASAIANAGTSALFGRDHSFYNLIGGVL